jgi:tight adherence protein C
MHARVGGGVVQAMQRVVDRGHGAVVEELADVLRMHRSGQRIVDALEQAARTTPEPNAARTYKLLANGVEYGADLAEGLRALSEDIRDQRAEAIRRAATKRRAAMLLPIIAVLAPVMLLFIAAPLPSIVLGGR